jgi:cytoskeletal protein CcmA (bactofilin family)
MREERGILKGNQVFSEAIEFLGSVSGDVHIVDGGKVYLRGNVYGNLTVTHGGRVHIFGQVTGDLTVKEGAKVIHSGIVGRDAINRGGRLYIEASAKVLGKVKTKDGETQVDPRAQVGE